MPAEKSGDKLPRKITLSTKTINAPTTTFISIHNRNKMASRKRNEFLDIDESDNDQSDNGYDSEAAEESKTRASKRRRILDSDNNHSDLEDDDDNDVAASADEQDESARNDDNNDYQESSKTPKEKPLKKPLKVKPPKKNKTGVVYLSSLPPYLKPMALKTLLVQRGFGPITKVFLTPAVHSTSGSGRRNNKRKTYSDGWVEFESKKTAKICAETLNANIVGGKKGGWYHDDIWNMKYLRYVYPTYLRFGVSANVRGG